MIPKLKPESKDCEYYGISLEEEKKWLRKNGGIMNILLKEVGKLTTKEIKEIKKEKRKSKKEKTQKEPKKKKKDTKCIVDKDFGKFSDMR